MYFLFNIKPKCTCFAALSHSLPLSPTDCMMSFEAESVDDGDAFENLCYICLDNEDDATVDGQMCGLCFACGHMNCGACEMDVIATRTCPFCRAPFNVSHEERFTRLWKLIHDRSPGRHTAGAQFNLATKYEGGIGVKQDYAEAIKWYRRAAEQGQADAQYNLGKLYEHGTGVDQDYNESVKFYQCAAEQGDADAQCNLGFMHERGRGLAQDDKEAAKWYRLAATQGDAGAQFNLASMYATGTGVGQDDKEAFKWYQLSAKQGDADSQSILGNMYAKGIGVPRDFAAVVQWWQLAAAQGHDGARTALNHVQQRNAISTPPPGTAITTIALTSGSKYNNKKGIVVALTEGQPPVDVGRAAVVLDGDAKLFSIKLMNLRVI